MNLVLVTKNSRQQQVKNEHSQECGVNPFQPASNKLEIRNFSAEQAAIDEATAEDEEKVNTRIADTSTQARQEVEYRIPDCVSAKEGVEMNKENQQNREPAQPLHRNKSLLFVRQKVKIPEFFPDCHGPVCPVQIVIALYCYPAGVWVKRKHC